MQQNREPSTSNKQLLVRFAGLATELLVMLGIGVAIGKYADKKLHFTSPVFLWILPLALIIFMFYRIIKATSKKQ